MSVLRISLFGGMRVEHDCRPTAEKVTRAVPERRAEGDAATVEEQNVHQRPRSPPADEPLRAKLTVNLLCLFHRLDVQLSSKDLPAGFVLPHRERSLAACEIQPPHLAMDLLTEGIEGEDSLPADHALLIRPMLAMVAHQPCQAVKVKRAHPLAFSQSPVIENAFQQFASVQLESFFQLADIRIVQAVRGFSQNSMVESQLLSTWRSSDPAPSRVAATPPWTISPCAPGAHGTAAAHCGGAATGKLMTCRFSGSCPLCGPASAAPSIGAALPAIIGSRLLATP